MLDFVNVINVRALPWAATPLVPLALTPTMVGAARATAPLAALVGPAASLAFGLGPQLLAKAKPSLKLKEIP